MPKSRRARVRLLTLLAFGSACALVIAALFALTGAHVSKPYQVTITAKDADNLVEQGRVRSAGVSIGMVEKVDESPAGARAVISVDPQYAPLHQGLTVRVGNRSLVEETYLDLKDGNGPPLPAGAEVPASAVETSTQVHDVLKSLDQPTRDALSGTLQSAGASTVGTREQLGQVMAGLGGLGRQGASALDAIAAQSADLRSLSRDTATVLNALDTGQGQIATLVDNADRVTAASAEQRQSIEGTMQRLPGVLGSARTATQQLTGLAGDLRPVAADLRAAGPPLGSALRQLPQVSTGLRSVLPPAGQVLDQAPATLNRVPTLGHDLSNDMIPSSRNVLQDVNPMISYLRPYGPEIGAFFANFNAIFNYKDDAGNHYWRTFLPVNDSMVSAGARTGALSYYNPLPPPNKVDHPGPFQGSFPRLGREPR